MAEKQLVKTQEVKASIGDLHLSPRKVRLVTDLIKRLSVDEARLQLQFLKKKAARPILKLINSCVASAQHNYQLNPNQLVIKNIVVNEGRTITRYKPRAQGRAFPIRRRTSKVELVLLVDQSLTKRAVKAKKPRLSAESDRTQLDKRDEIETEKTAAEQKTEQPKAKFGKESDRGGKIRKRFIDFKKRLFHRKTNA